jgi:iron(III) transport system substrate-binding protein
MWAATGAYFNVTGYNSNLVPNAEAPKTYEDLLDPKWSGKMIWSNSIGSGAPVFVGHILRTMGPEKGREYLEKLGQVGVRSTEASSRAVLDQVIGGEFGIEPHAFLHHALISQKAGAPVAWTEPQPLAGTFPSTGIAKNAPHPHAALLFTDFLLSEDAQKVLVDAYYAPSRTGMTPRDPALAPASRGVKVSYMNPDAIVKEQDSWQKLYEEIFVK